MTQELINVIKLHDWKKYELIDILNFCSDSLVNGKYIPDDIVMNEVPKQ